MSSESAHLYCQLCAVRVPDERAWAAHIRSGKHLNNKQRFHQRRKRAQRWQRGAEQKRMNTQ